MEWSEDDLRVIELLRKPGLSIKYLDDPTRDEIRAFIQRQHVEKGVSLSDIATKMIGNKTSGYTSWLCKQLGVKARPFEEARLKGIREKRRKYERKPFEGNEQEKGYLIGLRHGDVSASQPWASVVRVSSSTTHRTFAAMFEATFGPFGHVSQYPRYKKDTQSYEWNLTAFLDSSFDFLIDSRELGCRWARQSVDASLGYLAGFLDAEGNIGIGRDKLRTSLMVTYYNTDITLLDFVVERCRSLGYTPLGPYLDKKKYTVTSKYHIERTKDYYKVVIDRFAECQSFLSRLPLRHPERIAKKNLALSLQFREPWATVRDRVSVLRSIFRSERDAFVEEAKLSYLKTHRPPDA